MIQISHGKVDVKFPCCPHPDETIKHITLEYRQHKTIPQRRGQTRAVDDKSVDNPAHTDYGVEIPERQEEADYVRVL